ncbi:MAG: hypothetical protein RMJ98_20235 [Myxococcales bacterium]|nr:hypothetical protein [Polyangiaceae bacterium]MDW8251631.1 hypothetical protein [Myxococcales bacterium]
MLDGSTHHGATFLFCWRITEYARHTFPTGSTGEERLGNLHVRMGLGAAPVEAHLSCHISAPIFHPALCARRHAHDPQVLQHHYAVALGEVIREGVQKVLVLSMSLVLGRRNLLCRRMTEGRVWHHLPVRILPVRIDQPSDRATVYRHPRPMMRRRFFRLNPTHDRHEPRAHLAHDRCVPRLALQAVRKRLVQLDQKLGAYVSRHVRQLGHLGPQRRQLVALVEGRQEAWLPVGPDETHGSLLQGQVPEPPQGAFPRPKALFLYLDGVDAVAKLQSPLSASFKGLLHPSGNGRASAAHR